MKPIYNLVIITGSIFLFTGLAQEIPYERGERRDPFIPLISADGSMQVMITGTGGLEIEGIIYDPGSESLVLVNGEFYRIGDVVQEASVVSIYKDKVIFDRDGEEIIRFIREDVAEEGGL